MRTKRQIILLASTIALAACVVVVAVILHMANNRYENDAMVAMWKAGIGKPLVVEGIVLSQGKPAVGCVVDIETGAGGNLVTTGADGTFSINVGELELVALEVKGVGRIDWGLLWGPSLRDGVRFQIELK